MRRPASLGSRLAWLYSLAAAGVFSLAAWLIEQSVEAHFVEEDMMVMQGKFDIVRDALAQLDSVAELQALPTRTRDALIAHPGLALRVARSNGEVLYSSAPAGEALPEFPLVMGAPEVHKWSRHGIDRRGFTAEAPVAVAGEPPLLVTVALDIAHHEHFLRGFRQSLALVVGSAILLVAALSWLITRRALRPIRQMAHLASEMSASRLGERLKVERLPRELHELAEAFNAMLARLQDAFARLSEFSSDLAHELRTPISNLTMQTEVSLSRPRTADEYREVLFSSLEEYERLSRMVADMLFLAQADNGLMVPRRESFALHDTADALIEFFEPLASERALVLIRKGEARIEADPLMIRRAIANLLSNAIRHADTGTAVEIKIETADRECCVSVSNTGETIPPNHLNRLFDRFYRADASRTRSAEGAGLGLAITRSIVLAHGGRIDVASENRLNVFTLWLPLD
ncbi:sensor histidine kinase [Niveibacterium umoris]|uniref:Sensor protein n=1 Tax=Niveibacterium umoris TaxID=1193620 RepID=A0A840BIN8_9RHOO|nr:heavy metal sensor histidine kinase [Niveibacterium umoris]MBB4011488.1 two-component system heavy metal sensor histidine kinase CusS [Niveibacterium umoris]